MGNDHSKAAQELPDNVARQKIQLRKSTTRSDDATFARQINTLLLRSCTLRALSQPHEALSIAERAVRIAEEAGQYDQVSKCQLYRGLCLLEIGRFAEASCCFTRAASRRRWGVEAADWKWVAETKRRALLKSDARRAVGKGFKIVPDGVD